MSAAPDPVEEDRARWIALGWEHADAMACFMSINRAQKELVDRVHAALRPHGVSIIENSCLINLAMAPDHRQPLSRIAERLLIGAGRCNYVINSLEERSLVRREPHPSDGRVTLAIATAEGLRLAAAANRDLAAIRFGLGDVDPAAITAATAALANLRDRDR
jgi:DNA-binding MarR family transcriptional regulator